MIRRAFWLGAGATAGIMGYRRVSALGRRLSATVTPGAQATMRPPRPRRPIARTAARSAFGMARETVRFTRDVREGMDLYTARQNRDEPANENHQNENNKKDGR